MNRIRDEPKKREATSALAGLVVLGRKMASCLIKLLI